MPCSRMDHCLTRGFWWKAVIWIGTAFSGTSGERWASGIWSPTGIRTDTSFSSVGHDGLISRGLISIRSCKLLSSPLWSLNLKSPWSDPHSSKVFNIGLKTSLSSQFLLILLFLRTVFNGVIFSESHLAWKVIRTRGRLHCTVWLRFGGFHSHNVD